MGEAETLRQWLASWFALLLLTAMSMVRIAVSEESFSGLRSNEPRLRLVPLSLNLVPFAGVAFLWFIGVVRQSAPGCQRHQRVQSSSGTGPAVGVKSCKPGTSSAGSASGKSAPSGARSATVTWPLSATKRPNCSFVTAVASTHGSPTATRRFSG